MAVYAVFRIDGHRVADVSLESVGAVKGVVTSGARVSAAALRPAVFPTNVLSFFGPNRALAAASWFAAGAISSDVLQCGEIWEECEGTGFVLADVEATRIAFSERAAQPESRGVFPGLGLAPLCRARSIFVLFVIIIVTAAVVSVQWRLLPLRVLPLLAWAVGWRHVRV